VVGAFHLSGSHVRFPKRKTIVSNSATTTALRDALHLQTRHQGPPTCTRGSEETRENTMVFRRLLQDLSHDKEIIPLLSMVGVALSAMTYTMYRTATKNPDVRFIKGERSEGLWEDEKSKIEGDNWQRTSFFYRASQKSRPEVFPSANNAFGGKPVNERPEARAQM